MKVRDVMASPVIAIDPTDRLYEAFHKMRHHRIKHLPVIENDELVGIVSDRDLIGWATRENGTYLFPRKAVQAVMSSPVITCNDEDDTDTALDLLISRDISCLPVLNAQKQIVGIVTSKSFLQGVKTKEGKG
jgi:acetoin utilization protein AcuB